MNQMLELTDKYIKAAIIATANEVKQNVFSDPDAGKDRRQEEKGAAEDEMVR